MGVVLSVAMGGFLKVGGIYVVGAWWLVVSDGELLGELGGASVDVAEYKTHKHKGAAMISP